MEVSIDIISSVNQTLIITRAAGEAFLPRDARSAKRGIAIVSRPFVRLSVRNVEAPWAYLLS